MTKELDQIVQQTKETEERLLVSLMLKPKESILDGVLDVLVKDSETEEGKNTRELKDVMPHYHEQFQQIAEAIAEGTEPPQIDLNAKPADNPEALAKELVELYASRKLALVLAQKLGLVRQGHIRAADAMNMLTEDFSHIQNTMQEDGKDEQPTSIDDIIPELVADYEKWYAAKQELGTVGLPTGFKKFDEATGGLREGLHFLAASPGAGKTTFTLNIARNVASTGYPTLFVSFEMNKKDLWHTCIAAVSKTALKKVFNVSDEEMKPKDYQKIIEEHAKSLKNLYIMQGKPTTTVQQIKLKAKQLMQQTRKNRCLIIIDYIQYWAGYIKDKSNRDFRLIVGDLAKEIRSQLADALESPVLVIAAQSRSGQGSSDMTSLRESSDLEYSADSIMFLTLPEGDTSNGKSKGNTSKGNNGKGKGRMTVEIDDEEDDSVPIIVLPEGSEHVVLNIEKIRKGVKSKIDFVFHKPKGYFEEM